MDSKENFSPNSEENSAESIENSAQETSAESSVKNNFGQRDLMMQSQANLLQKNASEEEKRYATERAKTVIGNKDEWIWVRLLVLLALVTISVFLFMKILQLNKEEKENKKSELSYLVEQHRGQGRI